MNTILTGDMISLSEQELDDCDTSYNEGCNGGGMNNAFEFIIDNGGIDTEEDYPYKASDQRCDTYRKNAKVVSIYSYEDVPENDENSLKKAIAHQPVSVAIEGGGRAFQLYKSTYPNLLQNNPKVVQVWAQFAAENLDVLNQGLLFVTILDPAISSENVRDIFQNLGSIKEVRESPTKPRRKIVEIALALYYCSRSSEQVARCVLQNFRISSPSELLCLLFVRMAVGPRLQMPQLKVQFVWMEAPGLSFFAGFWLRCKQLVGSHGAWIHISRELQSWKYDAPLPQILHSGNFQ